MKVRETDEAGEMGAPQPQGRAEDLRVESALGQDDGIEIAMAGVGNKVALRPFPWVSS